MGFLRQNTEVVCHSLLQWTPFCQNSPLWHIHLGWPCMACLITALSYASLLPLQGCDPCWILYLSFTDFILCFFFFDLHILLKHLESLLSTITSLFLLILTYLEVWEAGFYFFIYITSKILMKSMWASSKYWNLPLQCYPCWQ